MATRTTKIIILLVIDVLFFLIELIAGYAVGSLALIADSFHMLNDVMSLIVALYAIKLSGSEASTKYSYGWHRAEILAALINGVFLLALCFSIFMEAIERFVNPPEISNPKLVVIVGCFGLASNVVGLFLFHDHGHSHGHEHDHEDDIGTPKPNLVSPELFSGAESQPLLIHQNHTNESISTPVNSPTHKRTRTDSTSSLSHFGHPAQTRAYVIAAAQDVGYGRVSSPPPSHRNSSSIGRIVLPDVLDESPQTTPTRVRSPSPEAVHYHPPHKDVENGGGGHGHGHGSMNMRALLLHVLGDALGNVGVISSGLIIWLTAWKYRFYSDPLISLIITMIIFSSALPLVKSASFILLQGVPESVNLDDLRADIQGVEGVLSIHELHVWQLSETRHIASVHILLNKQEDYMKIVRGIRKVLHDHDIHNGTIQPEFAWTGRGASPGACMVACPPGVCDPEQACCPAVQI